MRITDGPYAVLLLNAALDGPIRKNDLLLPLALACSLSAHIRFLFPMKEDFSRLIDSVFDRMFGELSLESKGIFYAKGFSSDKIKELLESAALVLTTNVQVKETAREKGLPHAFISQVEGARASIILRCLENIDNEELGRQLVRSSQIVNISYDDFIGHGRFSSAGAEPFKAKLERQNLRLV